MIPRSLRVWLLAVAAGSCITVSAQTPPTPTVSPADSATALRPSTNFMGEEPIALKLADAPLELVLQYIADLTGRTILRPQALPTPTITIHITKPVSKAEALLALETLLSLNQIGLTPMGDKFLKVVALPMVRTEAPKMIEGSAVDLPASGQIVTKLFQLEFLRVTEFLPQIGLLLNPNLGVPVIFEKTNAALITDSVSTIQRIELLIQKLDQPMMSNLVPRFYTVHYAKASDLVTKLRAMLQGPLQTQLGTATSYSADDRTNQIIIIADPRQLAFFDDLVAKLDVKSDPNTRTEVIYLKHAASKEVASLLTQLVSGQNKATQATNSVQPGQIVQPGQPQPNQPAPQPTINVPAGVIAELGSTQFSSLVTVIPDDRSNAVVINGTVDDIRLIKDLVDKIDIVLAQVCIEIVIAEVTLEDNATSGIDSLGLDVVGNKLVGITGTLMGAKNTTALSLKGSTKAAGYVTNIHGRDVSPESGFAATTGHTSLIGLINLSSTPRKNNATVLSVPTITTTHNKDAKLIIGSTRPVISSSTSANASSGSTPGYNTSAITQQDIGTTLTVKPLIGNDGSVQLDIKQLFTDSDPANDVTIDGNAQPVINKREVNSFVTVKSGEIIVLGGIQKQNIGHSSYRLGPIPWIGDLLGKRNRTNQRTELVIFIRPTVLTNTPADNEEALKRIDGMPNKDEIRQKLDPNYVPPKKPFYQRYKQIP